MILPVATSSAALFQGQAGLCPVERLNLALLVDGQHECLLRRIEIEADDVLNLFEEIGIVGDLEALYLMRLELVLGPDPLHARGADARLLGHRPHAPVRGVGRTLLHGLLDDFEFDRRADRLLARWLTAALDEAIDAGLDEILLPAPDGRFRNSDLAHDRHDAMTIGAHEHNPRALGDLLSRVPVGEKTLKFSARVALQHDSR